MITALELDKVAEDCRLEELAVELGHTVDLHGSDDGEMRHADVFGCAFLDDAHPRDAVIVIRPTFGNLLEEVAEISKGLQQ